MVEPPEPAERWDEIYSTRPTPDVSWFEPQPVTSLSLLDECGVTRDASVLDVGAGASCLVDALVDRRFDDVTALDVSPEALAIARRRTKDPPGVTWLVHDLLSWQPHRRYDVWHDRAMFHFLTAEAERRRYRSVLASALAPEGLVVIGTFASDGPKQCSGLPVARYDPAALVAELGDGFTLAHARRVEHMTPAGVIQPFTWIAAQRRAVAGPA